MFPRASPDSLCRSSLPTPVRAAFLLTKPVSQQKSSLQEPGTWHERAAPRGRAQRALLPLWSTSVLEGTLIVVLVGLVCVGQSRAALLLGLCVPCVSLMGRPRSQT